MRGSRKTDAALHEDILAGEHPVARAVVLQQARDAGLSEDVIQELFGK